MRNSPPRGYATGACFQFRNDNYFGVAFKVLYREQYPSLSLLAEGAAKIEPLITKSIDWAYEEEYRLIGQERSEAVPVQTIMTDNNFASYPAESLCGVYLGCRMPEAEKKAVVDLVRETGGRIAVREMYIRPDRYALLDRPVPL